MRIDIAVDLCGYTQHGRPGILAGRPAKIQVSYLGYPGTMGSPHIDYLLADKVLIPPECREGYSERIVFLPESYQVNTRIWKMADAIPDRAGLGLPLDGFVFCGFNNHFKITPDVFDVWMRLLRTVDNSVLWLLEGNALATENLRREASARGVSPDRLVFAPRLPIEQHLARQRRADLFLDTFNCGAHTTASDALWAGLPLVTCVGTTFASRVAASLLHALDLGELVTSSPSDYEGLALKLARDGDALAAIRDRLWRNRQTHPLFDTARFTRHLEQGYGAIWERARRGMPPEDIWAPSVDAH
jgi:predicted O-linked N-acetylglucosamine transferase (SPINDLY family)